MSVVGWPATDRARVVNGAVCKAGNTVGTLPRNPPPVGGDLRYCPRGDCSRSDALRGVGWETQKHRRKRGRGRNALGLSLYVRL